jgi:hypothetical protein
VKPDDPEWWYIHTETIRRGLETAEKCKAQGDYAEVANAAELIAYSASELATWAKQRVGVPPNPPHGQPGHKCEGGLPGEIHPL